MNNIIFNYKYIIYTIMNTNQFKVANTITINVEDFDFQKYYDLLGYLNYLCLNKKEDESISYMTGDVQIYKDDKTIYDN